MTNGQYNVLKFLLVNKMDDCTQSEDNDYELHIFVKIVLIGIDKWNWNVIFLLIKILQN
jgi:hypothetical protein